MSDKPPPPPPTLSGEMGALIRETLGALPADLLGWGIADWVAEKRKLAGLELKKKFERIAQERGLKPDGDAASPRLVLTIIQSAVEEDRDALQDIWARLLAAATDPKRAGQIRSSYIEIVKQLDPIDAIVLLKIPEATPLGGNLSGHLASKLQVSADEIVVSLLTLERLHLVRPTSNAVETGNATLAVTGRELLKVLT